MTYFLHIDKFTDQVENIQYMMVNMHSTEDDLLMYTVPNCDPQGRISRKRADANTKNVEYVPCHNTFYIQC